MLSFDWCVLESIFIPGWYTFLISGGGENLKYSHKNISLQKICCLILASSHYWLKIIDLKSSNFLICMEGCQINQPVWLIIPSYWYRLYENIILFSFSKQRISMIMFQLNSEAGYKEPLASCNPISCRSYPVYPACWLPSILGWGSTPALRPDQGRGIWLPLPWMGHCYTRGQTPTKPYHRHKSISIKIMTWGLIKRKLILLGLCPN